MTTLSAWFTQAAAAPNVDLTQLIFISSFTGAITAIFFVFLLGQRSAAKEAPNLRRQRSSRDRSIISEPLPNREISTASAPPLLQRGDSSGDSFRDDVQMSIGRHTEDATLRLPNAYLMQRGRAAHPSPDWQQIRPCADRGGPHRAHRRSMRRQELCSRSLDTSGYGGGI